MDPKNIEIHQRKTGPDAVKRVPDPCLGLVLAVSQDYVPRRDISQGTALVLSQIRIFGHVLLSPRRLPIIPPVHLRKYTPALYRAYTFLSDKKTGG